MRILIVEDDSAIATDLRTLLSRASYAADVSGSLADSVKAFDEPYDLYIIDRMLPDGDGTELVRKLRAERPHVPIILLTALSQTDDIILGLDCGADDYLTKPFDLEVLLARIRALLRRREREFTDPVIRIADLEINLNTRIVMRAGKTIDLSPREFALLAYMARHAGTALDRMTLLTHAWDENTDLMSNTVDVHIRYLRRKIDDGYPTGLIRTVKGMGYMLCPE